MLHLNQLICIEWIWKNIMCFTLREMKCLKSSALEVIYSLAVALNHETYLKVVCVNV